MMEKLELVMITMAMVASMTMKSMKVATTVSLAMISTLRMTALVPLKMRDLFQLQQTSLVHVRGSVHISAFAQSKHQANAMAILQNHAYSPP